MKNKKGNIVAIFIIVLITVGVFGWMFTRNIHSPDDEQKSTAAITVMDPALPVTQPAVNLNKNDDDDLINTAKQYVLTKPNMTLREGAKMVSWDDVFKDVDPAWIVSHSPKISGSNDENLGKIVTWFFIPNCEENPNSKNIPNWFDKNSNPCLGGFNLSVITKKQKTALLSQMN